MKKLLSLALVLVLLATSSGTVFAATKIPSGTKPVKSYSATIDKTYKLPASIKKTGDVYKSSDTKILKVGKSTGKFKAVAKGTAYIIIENAGETRYVKVTGKAAKTTTAVTATTQTAQTAAERNAELAKQRKDLLRLVNVERRKAGLSEVVWDDDFAACAQIRAEEMTIKKGHERPVEVNDGYNWPTNVSGKGIYNAPSVADEQGVEHNWIMENAGYGYQTAQDAMYASNGWMGSAGHRNNILRESHTRCGVGIYYNPNPPADGTSIAWALWFDDYED